MSYVDKDGFIVEKGYFPKGLSKKHLGVHSEKPSRKKEKKIEQREWILPCNTLYYDIDNALKELKIIDWRQITQLYNAQVGDIVYIYRKDKKPGIIKYKGAILEVNKSENIIDDSKYSADGSSYNGMCIEIAMFREYQMDDKLAYANLKEHGLLSRLMGPTVVKGTVADYLHSCDSMQIAMDKKSGRIPETCLIPFPIKVHEIEVKSSAKSSANSGTKVAPLDDTHTQEEKEKHASQLSVEELKEIAQKQSTKKPKEVKSTVVQKVRDPYIAEYARKRANGICQLCGKPAPFKRSDGEPYLESHHIVWLSNGGEDSIENTVALCPNCHRRMHVVQSAEDVKKLKEKNKNH